MYPKKHFVLSKKRKKEKHKLDKINHINKSWKKKLVIYFKLHPKMIENKALCVKQRGKEKKNLKLKKIIISKNHQIKKESSTLKCIR